MAVGPSAPPMMPIDAASLRPNLMKSPVASERQSAPNSAMKMPNCAAAPSSAVRGLAISGPKSVIAPTPMKIMIGKRPVLTPNSKK